jgi:hypothetical protein
VIFQEVVHGNSSIGGEKSGTRFLAMRNAPADFTRLLKLLPDMTIRLSVHGISRHFPEAEAFSA